MILGDRLIFALTNLWLYARYGRLMWKAYRRHGWWPNVARPESISERMWWRKFVDRSPLHVTFADKLATKEYIRARCPELAIPRTLWVGANADEIPDDVLRGDVYVKTNNGCSFNYRIRGGAVDRGELKKTTDRWMKYRFGKEHGEWAYWPIKPKLFVEEAIWGGECGLLDLQIRSGWGECILGLVLGCAKTPRKWAVYLDDNGHAKPGAEAEVEGFRLESLDGLDLREPYRAACAYARRLSEGVDYARFDFFWNGTTLYAGEITVYPGGGVREVSNPAMLAQLKAGWRLERSWFLSTPQGWPVCIYANALRRWLADKASAGQE